MEIIIINMTDLTIITQDINRQLADPKVATALLETTFKGLTQENMKKAIMEGVIRGYTFKDFLEKNIYAIKYGDGYSLVTSIDDARKRGMKSNVVGTAAPIYEMSDEKTPAGIPKPISCTITVKRLVGTTIGEFTAQVYFDEYYKEGKTWNGEYKPSMWDQKPRTMIAKVAEMHALRKACPEELAQAYIEEELKDKKETPEFDFKPHLERVNSVSSLQELQTVWASLPIQAKENKEIFDLKEQLKAKLTPPPTPPTPPTAPAAEPNPEGYVG